MECEEVTPALAPAKFGDRFPQRAMDFRRQLRLCAQLPGSGLEALCRLRHRDQASPLQGSEPTRPV